MFEDKIDLSISKEMNRISGVNKILKKIKSLELDPGLRLGYIGANFIDSISFSGEKLIEFLKVLNKYDDLKNKALALNSDNNNESILIKKQFYKYYQELCNFCKHNKTKSFGSIIEYNKHFYSNDNNCKSSNSNKFLKAFSGLSLNKKSTGSENKRVGIQKPNRFKNNRPNNKKV